MDGCVQHGEHRVVHRQEYAKLKRQAPKRDQPVPANVAVPNHVDGGPLQGCQARARSVEGRGFATLEGEAAAWEFGFAVDGSHGREIEPPFSSMHDELCLLDGDARWFVGPAQTEALSFELRIHPLENLRFGFAGCVG